MGKDTKKDLPKEIASVRQKANNTEPYTGRERDQSKKIKILDSLIKMIQSFPRDDPTNDKLQDELSRIRGKVKQVCSMLNIQPDFRINYENSGLSF